MSNRNITLEEFFYDNLKGLDTLVWLHKIFNKFFQEQNKAVATYNSLISSYMDFKKGYQEEQKDKAVTYHSRICKRTETDKWWLYCHKRVLGIYIKKDAPRIGIECVFEKESYKYPLGKFHIYVATWDKPEFGIYERDINKAFPNKKDRGIKNRKFRLVEELAPENNQDVIISILEKTYKTLTEIIDKHEKSSK